MNTLEYEILNKVFISGKQKSKRRTLFKIIISISFVFILISLIVGKEMIAAIAPVSLPLAVSFSGLAGYKVQGVYKNCPCNIILGQELIIENKELDREDSLGMRNEKFVINNNDIEEVQYSTELNSLKIVGNGKKEITWITRAARQPKHKSTRVAYIYLDNYNKKELLEVFKNYLLVSITQVN